MITFATLIKDTAARIKYNAELAEIALARNDIPEYNRFMNNVKMLASDIHHSIKYREGQAIMGNRDWDSSASAIQ